MKKFLTLTMVAALSLPMLGQDLLVGKDIFPLGEAKTWSGTKTVDGEDQTVTYTFEADQLSKLVKEERNTDNVFLFPERQNDANYNTDENKEIGIQGFYVDMGSSKTVESVYTTWEGAAANELNIYVLNEEPNLNNLNNPAYIGEDLGQYQEKTFTLEENNTGRYLVFEPTEATNWGWGVKIRSISAYGDTQSVTALTVSEVSIPANSSATVTVIPVNVVGEALHIDTVDNISLTCDVSDAVNISSDGMEDGTFSVEGLIVGTYTLTATAEFNGETVEGSATLYVTYDWKNEPNIAANKDVTYRWKEDGVESGNTGDKVTDLDIETYYEYNGDWAGGDGWIVIDLGDVNDHIVDAVEVYFIDDNVNENNGINTFKLSFGANDATLFTDDAVWTPNENEGWITTSTLNKIAGAYVTYIVPQEERAAIRYVAYLDGNNPKGKPKIGQIYVAGTEIKEELKVTDITLSVDKNYIATGEEITVTPTVIDQYGGIMSDVEVIVYVNDEALEGLTYTPETIGKYSIVAKSGDIESEALILNVIAKAENDFTKPNSETKIEYAASKGEAGLSYDPFTQETGWTEEELGTALEIVFDSPVDLELLKFRWEAACPADYTISVIRQTTRAAEGEEELIMEVSGREFIQGTNPIDRLYHDASATGETSIMNGNSVVCGADLSNIKTLKLTPTTKASNYDLRLYGIDAIGTQDFIDTSAVETIAKTSANGPVDVINLQGVVVKKGVNGEKATDNLPKGIYIIGGKKVAVK